MMGKQPGGGLGMTSFRCLLHRCVHIACRQGVAPPRKLSELCHASVCGKNLQELAVVLLGAGGEVWHHTGDQIGVTLQPGGGGQALKEDVGSLLADKFDNARVHLGHDEVAQDATDDMVALPTHVVHVEHALAKGKADVGSLLVKLPFVAQGVPSPYKSRAQQVVKHDGVKAALGSEPHHQVAGCAEIGLSLVGRPGQVLVCPAPERLEDLG